MAVAIEQELGPITIQTVMIILFILQILETHSQKMPEKNPRN
jgi:hypothetical protein